MCRVLVAIALMLAPLTAAAQSDDGGVVPADCADLDEEGRCVGETATWCGRNDDGVDAGVATFACGAVEARCEEVAGLGAWCGVSLGERCALPSAGGRRQLACVGAGGELVEAGCDLEGGCVGGLPACSLSDEARCEGAAAVLACAPFGQPLVVDCAALGGACASGACVGLAEGASCGEGLACEEGLVCAGGEAGVGRCAAAGAPAERAPLPADPPASPAPSCRAAGVPGGARGPGLLALGLALACVGRRRTGQKGDGSGGLLL